MNKFNSENKFQIFLQVKYLESFFIIIIKIFVSNSLLNNLNLIKYFLRRSSTKI